VVEYAGTRKRGVEGVAGCDPWAEGHFVQYGDVGEIDFGSTEEVGPRRMVGAKAVGELTNGEFQEDSLQEAA
jgi:hypothetical protein